MLIHFSSHYWYPYAINEGWIPLVNKVCACFNNYPAKTTTEVVPSPAYISWAFEIYTNIFAVGWTTCIFFIIVAPSFVIKTYPFES